MNHKCEYCKKCNGDHIEDTNYCDYYTCGKTNEQDLEKYHSYSSLENIVDETECKEKKKKNCLFRKEIIKYETANKTN